jgi:hypothetical protein
LKVKAALSPDYNISNAMLHWFLLTIGNGKKRDGFHRASWIPFANPFTDLGLGAMAEFKTSLRASRLA